MVGDTSGRSIGDSYLLGSIYFFRDQAVAMGPSLNEQFASTVDESITTLAADILSGRRNEDVIQLIGQHKEELKAEPETREEWKERMNIDLPDS